MYTDAAYGSRRAAAGIRISGRGKRQPLCACLCDTLDDLAKLTLVFTFQNTDMKIPVSVRYRGAFAALPSAALMNVASV